MFPVIDRHCALKHSSFSDFYNGVTGSIDIHHTYMYMVRSRDLLGCPKTLSGHFQMR